MSSSSYQINEFFQNSETQLGKLIAQAQSVDALSQLFAQTLDPELMAHCKVGLFDNGVLTLFSDSAAFATRIRYSVPILLSQLRANPKWAGLRSIQVKVQTFQSWKSAPQIEAVIPASLSSKSIEHIQSLIDSLKPKPGQEVLVKSLEKLVKSPAGAP